LTNGGLLRARSGLTGHHCLQCHLMRSVTVVGDEPRPVTAHLAFTVSRSPAARSGQGATVRCRKRSQPGKPPPQPLATLSSTTGPGYEGINNAGCMATLTRDDIMEYL
jgi:hypothetical protein